MKSETITVQQLFQDRRQYRVPFYQRAYVWEREQQWRPLWDDIVGKAEVRATGDEPAPHFLGAIVLEPQQRTSLRGVETLNIIDGQQRLTTLQYFLAALTLSLREYKSAAIEALVEACLWNSNPSTMEQPDVEKFKLWPTFRDRLAYRTTLQAVTLDDLRTAFSQSFTQAGTLRKVGADHPAALEAVWFFHEQVAEWIHQPPAPGESDAGLRLEQLAEAVFRDLKLVSISLDADDDAQVIFETLNGRGAELHSTDLIRNFVFMRAEREKADSANLYDTLWSPFEAAFWTEEQRRGRLKRPRLEWFVQTTLQAETSDEVDVGTLYSAYRRHVLGTKPPIPAQRQLVTLSRYSDDYRQFVTGSGDKPIARIGRRIGVWDVSPMHPLILRIAVGGASDADQTQMYDDLVSYIVRRAVCGLTSKNYNKVFLQLLKGLRDEGIAPSKLRQALASLDGAASRWPSDDEFRLAWMTGNVHSRLVDISRIRAMFSELETGLRSSRSEEPFAGTLEYLDIDHILPESWYEHWPLNETTVSEQEASFAAQAGRSVPDSELGERVKSILRRESLKATFGNLTLAHYGVNRSLQNRAFPAKRDAFFAESSLQLNRSLMRTEAWDETAIEKRGSALFEIARAIWQGPANAATGIQPTSVATVTPGPMLPDAPDQTWRDDVRNALVVLGGRSSLDGIYSAVSRIRREAGRSLPPTTNAIIRRVLEDHSSDSENYRPGRPDLFRMPEGRGAGVWSLR